jgi:hypothetical protein
LALLPCRFAFGPKRALQNETLGAPLRYASLRKNVQVLAYL